MALFRLHITWGLVCLSYFTVASRVEAGSRRQLRLPDLLLRDFINIPDEGPGRDGSAAGGDVNMTQIDDILRERYGVQNATTRGKSSAFMLDLYRKLQKGESLARASGHRGVDVSILQADTVRSFKPKDSRQDKSKIELTFSLAGVSPEEITKRAELRLRSSGHHSRRVYKVRVTVLEGGDVLKRLTYKVRSGQATRDGSALIDLTAIVQDVLEAGHGSATLHLTVRPKTQHRARRQSRRGDQSQVTAEESATRRHARSARSHMQPENGAILVIYSKDRKFFTKFSSELRAKAASAEEDSLPSSRRQRRSSRTSGTERRHRVSGGCRQLDFTVDFQTIGWDKWIIYPASFNSYRCGGKCKVPLIQTLNPTNHAVLQSLMRRRDRDSAPWPCCVPTRLHPISMLYYEHDEIVVRSHEDMVVDECSCR